MAAPKRSFVAAAVLLLLLLGVASLVPVSGQDERAKKNKFTRREIGQFFRDYPDMLNLVYKAMNLKKKAQGKTLRWDPPDCVGCSTPGGSVTVPRPHADVCTMCLRLEKEQICENICS